MQARKRKARIYENTAKTRKAVNLDDEKVYNTWRTGRCAAHWWTIFEKRYLDSNQHTEGQKGEEFLNVYNQVLAGESGGACKFSAAGSEDNMKTGLDWQAWLLCNLV